jgi:peptidoglycan/LPS O-acetylase OafA/YrhL
MKHLPAIDGLRALAVLAVVAYHAGLPVPAGFVGVDVFFVISGYVITRMLAEEHADGSDRPRWRSTPAACAASCRR